MKKVVSWNFRNIDRTSVSFRKKVVLILVWLAIVFASLMFTSSMARQLREKENYEIGLWALAIERLGQFNVDVPLSDYNLDSRHNIPFIRTPDHFEGFGSNLIPYRIFYPPGLFNRQFDAFAG